MATSDTIQNVEEKLFSEPLSSVVAKLSYFRRLERVWLLIESNFADPAMSLERGAMVSGTNKNHLNVLLRKATKLTFHQLLVRYRILRAISMMRDRNYSFLEIAIDSGFGSLNSFERNFRKLMGMTPRDFKVYHVFQNKSATCEHERNTDKDFL